MCLCVLWPSNHNQYIDSSNNRIISFSTETVLLLLCFFFSFSLVMFLCFIRLVQLECQVLWKVILISDCRWTQRNVCGDVLMVEWNPCMQFWIEMKRIQLLDAICPRQIPGISSQWVGNWNEETELINIRTKRKKNITIWAKRRKWI